MNYRDNVPYSSVYCQGSNIQMTNVFKVTIT